MNTAFFDTEIEAEYRCSRAAIAFLHFNLSFNG